MCSKENEQIGVNWSDWVWFHFAWPLENPCRQPWRVQGCCLLLLFPDLSYTQRPYTSQGCKPFAIGGWSCAENLHCPCMAMNVHFRQWLPPTRPKEMPEKQSILLDPGCKTQRMPNSPMLYFANLWNLCETWSSHMRSSWLDCLFRLLIYTCILPEIHSTWYYLVVWLPFSLYPGIIQLPPWWLPYQRFLTVVIIIIYLI